MYANKLVEMNKNSATLKLIPEDPANGMGENLYHRKDTEKAVKCLQAALSWLVYFYF